MESKDLELLRALQAGIPIEPEPFKKVGEQLKLSQAEVIGRIANMIQSGKIKRLAASISHRSIGYRANAMVVWNVPNARVDEVGEKMASYKEVSHCYLRSRNKHWKYNIYIVIHGRSKKACLEIVDKIAKETKIEDYEVLFSERELKKTGIKLW
jgi:DNA-binding Lrp family transcriptional regulator